MKEKIQITIENLDDIRSILKSIELLFTKLIYYYADTNTRNLVIFILSVSVCLGQVMTKLGIDEDNYEEFLK
jgi:hypothetical protein